MRNQHLLKFLLLIAAVILLTAACRREEETPTPTLAPTAAVVETDQPEGDADAETTETTPTVEPAAPAPTPEPASDAAIDPVDPADIDWHPQVIYSSPLPGEETMLDGAITIKFDQPMDEASVEAAFNIQESSSPTETVSTAPVAGQFSWPAEDTLIFTPSESLARMQAYDVRIGEDAAGRNGKSIASPVSFRFETVGFLEVSQVLPEDGTSDVSLDAPVTVMFNRPVVPLVTTGQQAGLPDFLEIDPPVAGSGEWTATSLYRFVPDVGWEGSTEYTVSIPAGLEDVTGAVLDETVTWSFVTTRPSVAEIQPGTGFEQVAPNSPMTITFNTVMDQPSTESAISLYPASDPGSRVALDFSWNADGRTVYAQPAGLLELGTRYTLTVADSARALNGSSTLDRETDSTFTTVPLPSVVRTSPSNGSVAEPYQYGVNIEFASPMDIDTFEDRIQIEPEPTRLNFNINFNGQFVFLDFSLEPNTDYTVTVPGDAADPYGNTLGEDYIFSFSTPGNVPLATLNLPERLAQLTTSYPSDVTVAYRNISRIEAELFDVGLPAGLLGEPWRVQEYSPAGSPLRTWNQEVNPEENTVETLTLSLNDGAPLPSGVYYLRISAPEINRDDSWWQNQRVILLVADTNLVVKEMPDEVHVWATDLETGTPVSDLEVTLYRSNGAQLDTAVTNSDGLASFPYEPLEFYLSGVTVVGGAPGEARFGAANSNWNQGVSPWQFQINSTSGRELPEFTYIYTDRPIYRPGDTVHFKGILRETNYSRYALPEREAVMVSVEYFSFFEGGQSFPYAENLPLDEFGTFDGNFTIPSEARLGTYRIYIAGSAGADIENASRDFQIAQYRAPEFEVSVTPTAEEALRGEPVEFTVEARYFFGAPACDLAVNWTVSEQSYTPHWEGLNYNFNDDDNFFFYFDPTFSGFTGDQIASGSGRLDAQGRLVISLPANLLEDVAAGSRLITVEAQVSDITEFPVSARGSMVLHAADNYVGIRPESSLVAAESEATLELITVDWEGNPVPNRTVEVVFYERTYETIRQRRFGVYESTYEPVDTEVDRVTVTTGEDGEATATFVPEFGGTYRAVATVTDPAGRQQSSSTFLWVSDAAFVAWRTDSRERRMDLTPDQGEYEVGDTARILVQSPFTGPVNAWVTIERGNMIDQWLVTLETNSDVVEIPITPDLAPNAYVSIAAVKGVDETNQYADIRLGIVELRVNPERLFLNISLNPRDDELQPGQTVTYDIRATDYAGNGVEASLSLALVDLAVLSLVPDNAPEIGASFYAPQPYRSQTGSGLFVSGEGLELEIPGPGGGFGGGGGDAAMESAAALEEDEEDVRRDFPDTAFWEANLITSADGTATIDIPLPDSTTTWRLSSKGVTADTLVGQSNVDVVATLPLLLRPVTPRFFTVGDALQIGTAVNNNTDEALDVTVTLAALGVTLQGEAEQTVTIPARSQTLVRWPVTVDDVEFVDLTFRAAGGDYSDATKPTFGFGPDQLLPVYRFDARDLVGSSGVLEEAGREVEAVLLPEIVDPRRGELVTRLEPSLAAAIFSALEATEVVEIQKACAHQAANIVLPNAATKLALAASGVLDSGLEAQVDSQAIQAINRLEQLQRPGGGWTYCGDDTVDEYLTAYILFALGKADEAGYDVSDIDIDAAVDELSISDPLRLGSRYAVNRQAFFLYALSIWGETDTAELDALVEAQRELLDPYARAYLIQAYQNLGQEEADNVATLLSDLDSVAIVSATGAHWEDVTPDVRNLNSDIRGTAVVLSALARVDADNPLGPQTVRWLMSAREVNVWPTPFETVWTLFALTDWVTATGELDADYSYRVSVNNELLTGGQFDADNIAETDVATVPMRRLPAETTNYVAFEREDGPGRLYYTLHLDAYLDANAVQPVSRGIQVERVYTDAACDPETETCEPIDSIAAGQQVRVQLTIIAPNDLPYVVVEDPLPAGTEAQDPNLLTTRSDLGAGVTPDEVMPYGYWGWWVFNDIQFRDEMVVFTSSYLPAGTYQYTYYLQAVIPGDYQVMPAVAFQEFFPEVFGRSDGLLFTVAE
jgi:uncharacterized protein YfaS (alpha-2-macroglobulin family)